MGTLLAAFERSIRFRIRGLDGKTLREFSHVQGGGWSWQKDWIYRDGQLLGTDSAASGVRHAHNDHLGTPRVFSDVFGNYQERRHLYPFGEQALATGPAPVTMTFTGHERDGNWTTATADDLDYMMARYYHPQLGRFLSTDPINSAKPTDPITWNKYAYVGARPLNYSDPTGEDGWARIALDNDIQDLLQKKITREQYSARVEARGQAAAAVGSFFVPGPEDVVIGAVAAKAASRGFGKVLQRLGSFFKRDVPRTTPRIHMGKQGKHIPSHNHYIEGRSILRADPERLATRAGTGEPVNQIPRGQPGFKERVDFEEVIDDFVEEGVATPTTKGIITYAADGTIHIVPVRP